jgi:spermidine synthase
MEVSSPSLARAVEPRGESLSRRVIPLLFFFSGASSLIFETIFTRLLTYTFGNTAHATSTVLAAFLGGLALGALIFGRWVDRRPASLWIYGVLELLIALFCFFIPQFFGLLTHAYVALHHQFQLGPAGLTVVRFGLASLVILVPTVLMGGTLPALARFVSSTEGEGFESEVSRLYGWNTLGAAVGTLTSTYLLMPAWGVRNTLVIACAINVGVFVVVAALARRPRTVSPARETAMTSKLQPDPPHNRRVTILLVAGAFLTGSVALAYEVLWTHVLSFLIGNTVYAFGVMLFTFLCGLGIGAQIVARRLRNPAWWPAALAGSQLLLAVVIFGTLPLWDRVPDIFAQGLLRALELDVLSVAPLLLGRAVYVAMKLYGRLRDGRFPWGRGVELGFEILVLSVLVTADTTPLWKHDATYFISAEFLRFICAFYLLIIPAVLLGLSFPLLLNLASHGATRVGSMVGGIYSANTMGAILGSTLMGFVLLPKWGSFTSLRASATVNLALGLVFALALVPLRRNLKLLLGVVSAALAVVFWTGPMDWDARRMSRGSYVYFNDGWPIERVLYHAEDVHGGLTSVIETHGARVLLSNGKFQGNNTGEVGAQIRIALKPILFTREFDRALVIGLGTGNTLRTVSRFPFRHLDAVEIAPHIVEAARRHFADINGLVFDRDPRVRVTIADGRNFLLLTREQYDLITIEISSIWISGAGDLYNKEFYELCRRRMKEHGVLQQWVQIHHMRTQDFLVILNTAAQVFPHVAFFQGPEQGVLIASKSPLQIDYRRIREFDARPEVKEELSAINLPSMMSLLGELMLYGDSMRAALAELPRLGGRPANFVSTDLRPYLEYQTPRGNTLPQSTVFANLNFMLGLRPADPLPPGITIINLETEDERNLVRGYSATQRGDLRAAVEYLQRVGGPMRARALEEIALIESGARRPKLMGF